MRGGMKRPAARFALTLAAAALGVGLVMTVGGSTLPVENTVRVAWSDPRGCVELRRAAKDVGARDLDGAALALRVATEERGGSLAFTWSDAAGAAVLTRTVSTEAAGPGCRVSLEQRALHEGAVARFAAVAMGGDEASARAWARGFAAR
jgi:hypothetical protein